jgi:hypothetical protein
MTARDQTRQGRSWVRPATVAFLVAMAALGAVAPLTRPLATPSAETPAGSSPAEAEELPAPAFGS